jgi:hypothetical protein
MPPLLSAEGVDALMRFIDAVQELKAAGDDILADLCEDGGEDEIEQRRRLPPVGRYIDPPVPADRRTYVERAESSVPLPCPYALNGAIYQGCPRDAHQYDPANNPRCENCPAGPNASRLKPPERV